MIPKEGNELFDALRLRNHLVNEECKETEWYKKLEEKWAENDPVTLHMIAEYRAHRAQLNTK